MMPMHHLLSSAALPPPPDASSRHHPNPLCSAPKMSLTMPTGENGGRVVVAGRHRVSKGDTMFLHLAHPGGGNIVVSGQLRLQPTVQLAKADAEGDGVPVTTVYGELTETALNAAWCMLQRRHTRLRAWIETNNVRSRASMPYGPPPDAAATTPTVPLQGVEVINVSTAEDADAAMQEAGHRLLHRTFECNVEAVPVGICLVHHTGTPSYRLVLGVSERAPPTRTHAIHTPACHPDTHPHDTDCLD